MRTIGISKRFVIIAKVGLAKFHSSESTLYYFAHEKDEWTSKSVVSLPNVPKATMIPWRQRSKPIDLVSRYHGEE